MDEEKLSTENGSPLPTEGGLEGKMANLAVEEFKHVDSATEVGDSVTEVGSEIDHERLGAEMQERCRILVAELEEYQEYLKKHRKENAVELRTFRSGLNAEMKLINKLAAKDSSKLKIAHSIRSSNFLFYASVWSTAKSCRGITALSRRFYWEPHAKITTINGRNQPGTKQKAHSAVADIVCEDGLEWVKVSSHTEKRIIWDFAKAGWVVDSDSEDDFDDVDGGDAEGLLKQVETLMKAAKATRVRYRTPKVRLVLPRISREPKAKEVVAVLQRLKNLGVVVQTKEDLGEEESSLADVVEKLVPDQFEEFSEVLNSDCTVMLAFVSDISHDTVEGADWHNKMIQSQRKLEAEEHLLPCVLWPACASRKLVCTREAANRMLEIVNTIGTESEKARTALLLNTPVPPYSTFSPLAQPQTITAFQKLSQYPIPSTWQIPIKIISVDIPAMLAELPASAKVVAEKLSEMNRSVLLYGWWSGRTTITSNRAVVRDVEGPIEEFRVGEEVGPEVWSCSKPRSLVGKEKERRGKVE